MGNDGGGNNGISTAGRILLVMCAAFLLLDVGLILRITGHYYHSETLWQKEEAERENQDVITVETAAPTQVQLTPAPAETEYVYYLVPTEGLNPTPDKVVVEREVEVIREVPVTIAELAGSAANRYGTIYITQNDIDLLAKLAWREARGERQLGMRMVVEVVLNRVQHSRFPNTIYDVLYQPGQFAPGYGVPELDDITPTQDQYDAVYTVLAETPITDPDVVFFATTPLFGDVFMRVGGHYFTYYPD